MTKLIAKKGESEAGGPIRILQISSGSKIFSGVSSFLFEVYKKIDRSRVQFDFLSTKITTYALYKDEIEQMGAKIFELGVYGNIITRKIRLFPALFKFFKNNSYKIVHINSSGLLFALTISFITKCVGVKTRIVHSHNSLEDKITFENLLIYLLKPLLPRLATDYFACSKKAAESMFSKRTIKQRKVKIIKYGIDVENFIFNEEIRKKRREELKIKNKFAVGHVGRFQYQKNHSFLIKVFKKMHDKYQNSVLLLIGEGELEEEIKIKVKKLGLDESVFFLGVRSDVNELMQAMDVFVLPSYYEGLGIVGIEAQAAGLQVIASNSTPSEMKITELATFLSLNQSVNEWSEKILQYRDGYDRRDMSKEIIYAGFQVNDTASRLEKMYLEKR